MENSGFLASIHTSVIFLSFCKLQGLCLSVMYTPGTDDRGRYHLFDIRHCLVGAVTVVLGSSGCPQGNIDCYITGDSSTWWCCVLLLNVHCLVGAVTVVLGSSGCPQGSIDCYITGDSSTWWCCVLLLIVHCLIFLNLIYMSLQTVNP